MHFLISRIFLIISACFWVDACVYGPHVSLGGARKRLKKEGRKGPIRLLVSIPDKPVGQPYPKLRLERPRFDTKKTSLRLDAPADSFYVQIKARDDTDCSFPLELEEEKDDSRIFGPKTIKGSGKDQSENLALFLILDASKVKSLYFIDMNFFNC